MMRKLSLLVSAAVFCAACLGGVACQKIDPDRDRPRGTLTLEAHPFPDAIPAEYGELVGIIPDESGWATLVFEKHDKTIVMLAVRPYRGGLASSAVLIPRR